ncbi:MAG: hypothetical protein NTW86_23865, partial [Candidatus Sumerlaeota bacterium]|nr:hypothetical protein [Candidatus Sumerlaeota bacterium]
GAVPVPGGIGEYRLEFALEAEGSAWAGGHRRVWVLPALAGAPTEAVGVLEGRGREKALKAMQAIGASVEDDPAQAALIIAALEGDAAELAPRIGELARAGKRVLVFAATAPDMAKMVETMGAQGTVRPCRGNWSPAGHYCEDPSLLAGLPPDRLLGQAYGDVRPELCVRPFQEGALAGCLTYSEGGAAEVPLEVWWGSTIFERPVGAGSAALCAFRLLDGAPARPVARRLLWNLLSRLR